MIARTVSLFFLSLLTFSIQLSTSYAEQLVAEVKETNVNLDWSGMPDANSYDLYYALADFKGDIDISTLGSVEMGDITSVNVPNLPSGLIIYTAILGHTNDKDIVSNVVKFMPFGGSVTFPDSGDILIQVDEPGGIGTISVNGTRNSDGDFESITQISADDGSGPYNLYISEDKPWAYSTKDFTVYFMYHSDGTVGLHTVEEELLSHPDLTRSANYKVNISTETINCNAYSDRKHFKNALLFGTSNMSKQFDDDTKTEAKKQNFPIEMMRGLAKINLIALSLDIKNFDESLLNSYFDLLAKAYEGIQDEILEQYMILFEQQCSDKLIVYEYGDCPVPSGAEYNSYIADNELTEFYTLDDHYVGPFKDWLDTAREMNELTACFDENGKLHNIRKIFYEMGPVLIRLEDYEHGVILKVIEAYPSGNIRSKSFYKDGEIKEWISYYDHPGRTKQWIRYIDGLQEGWQEFWYENGNRNNRIFYVNGKKEGEWWQYREDGSLSELRHYKDNLAHGTWTYYEDDGTTVQRICTYEDSFLKGCTYL